MRVAVLAALLAAPLPAIAQGQPPPLRFHVVNAGNEPITAVHASPVTDSHWGDNLIGRVHIPPGSGLAISTRERDTCLFDLRIVWASGRNEDRRRENFCGSSRVFRVDGAAAQR
ncbi:MAG TPA: hypothetical protein VD970_14585 [Acetobacteraceae bacterium]|nr:hypothetical protein [Acetobacteraceae bacterium]